LCQSQTGYGILSKDEVTKAETSVYMLPLRVIQWQNWKFKLVEIVNLKVSLKVRIRFLAETELLSPTHVVSNAKCFTQ
jgi:hypothetical protein